jgi:hypothetical protein
MTDPTSGNLLTTGVMLVFFAAWLTHIILGLMHGEWVWLVAGMVLFPVGIAHGIGIWFNV